MKILQLGKFHPVRGGVEKVMTDLLGSLAEAGIDCDMLCASLGKPATISPNPHSRIFAVRSLGKLSATMIAPAMISRLRHICHNYDIIHIHHPDPMAALALRLSGFRGKVVLHWHSDIVRQRHLLRLFMPIQRWLLRRADVIIGTSPVYIEGSAHLAGMRHKCVCVPIGIAPFPDPDPAKVQQIKSLYPGKHIIFAMGRLVRYKGFEFLIKAAQYLPDDYVTIIGGDGSLRHRLQECITDSELDHKVKLQGFIDDKDLSAYYHASSAFCLSSIQRTEAFGVVQIEAMSCGTPVISTDIPGSGVSWVNAHGISGMVVPPADPQALARAITYITQSPVTLDQFSARAIERFYNLFTLRRMAETIINLYYNTLNRTSF